jgi:hypothetical protein
VAGRLDHVSGPLKPLRIVRRRARELANGVAQDGRPNETAGGRMNGHAPDESVPVRRLVVHTTDFNEAHRTMERVFLPIAMWPMEPLKAVDIRLDCTQVDQMMTSIVRFGRDIGLRSVESDSYHVTAPVSGVAESELDYTNQ